MPTLLIVEDDEATRDALTRRLERRGYTVLIAVDGQQAVTIGRSEKPDLILMDLALPGVDGWDATAYLKMDEVTRHIPIIVLSAHARPNDQQQAFAAGADDFRTKPVHLDELIDRIETLLGRKKF
jgi:two-component system, cell cycle response regulator DivK